MEQHSNGLPTIVVYGGISCKDFVVHDPEGFACNIVVVTLPNSPVSVMMDSVLRIQGDITLQESYPIESKYVLNSEQSQITKNKETNFWKRLRDTSLLF